jgi:hypothetical protein
VDLTKAVQDDWNRGDRQKYIDRFQKTLFICPPNTQTIKGKNAIRPFANTFPEMKVEFSILEIMGAAPYAYVRVHMF